MTLNLTPTHPVSHPVGDPIPMLSLRDYFAGQALMGLLSHHGMFRPSWGGDMLDIAAEKTYQVADAMLAEREKQNDT